MCSAALWGGLRYFSLTTSSKSFASESSITSLTVTSLAFPYPWTWSAISLK